MFNLLITLSPAVLWLLSSLALLLIELATPGLFFFISFSFGCLFGALGAALGYSLVVQCSVALLVSLIQFNAMRRRLRQFTDSIHLPTNMHALVGKKAIVINPINMHQSGHVKIGGEVWVARAQTDIAVDQTVQVVKIEGNSAIVKLVK